jgi:hypothetical protein
VLVWAFIPGRVQELALLEAGFTPALATWRAPATPETRTLAAQMAKRPPATPVFALGTAPPVTPETDERAHADRVEHAWMRWAACMDTRVLMAGNRTYDFRGPPRRDGSTLVLRYRTRDADLQIALDVERHPLIYDVAVGFGGRGASLTTRTIPGVAWEDFPALVDEIGRLVADKPAKSAKPTAAASSKGRKATTGPSPAPTGPVPLAWGERIAARFNAEPGPRLRLEGRRGQQGLLFVVLREGDSTTCSRRSTSTATPSSACVGSPPRCARASRTRSSSAWTACSPTTRPTRPPPTRSRHRTPSPRCSR